LTAAGSCYYISACNEMANPLGATVDVLKALGHPVRLRLVAMLRGGELCVCQMTAVLELAASTVSAHLTDLKRAGLVEDRKDGRWVVHRLSQDAAAKGHLEPVWRSIERDPQVEADARLLRELRCVPVEELCRVDLDLRRLGIRRKAAEPGRPRREAAR
jgi:ArsR family transcriptional regulator, arsenate/arsenite/antimonite-responsive transcriptional repressor